jgi:hypothetical protein
MGVIVTASSEIDRGRALLRAYVDASDDVDISVRTGCAEDGEPSILVSVGARQFPLLATVARALANSIEQAINANPREPTAGLDNLLLVLRLGADEACRLAPPPTGTNR